MKLTYRDNTPEEYEPPHFRAMTDDALGHFVRRPFSM